MTSAVQLLPSDFGLSPAHFPEYRDVQLEALDFVLESRARFIGLGLPGGSGKSLLAVSLALASEWRTAALTMTKGLQAQYARDFDSCLHDIRGRANYPCSVLERTDCRAGARMGCEMAGTPLCTYDGQKRKARGHGLVLTNYDYWLSVWDKGGGLERGQKEVEEGADPNPFELLVADECHLAESKLCDYLSVRLGDRELDGLEPIGEHPRKDDLAQWQKFAIEAVKYLKPELEGLQLEGLFLRKQGKLEEARSLARDLGRLERKLDGYKRIANADAEDWVCEKWETRNGDVWAFDVAHAFRYAKRYLFRSVPKVVLMSATLNPKTMGLLGIGKDEYEFREWPRIFPANRNPVYLCPARKRNDDGEEVTIGMRHRMAEEDKRLWLARIDEILNQELGLGLKGIVHTVSYDRQQYLLSHSRHARVMMGNTADPDSENAAEVADRFRKAKGPRVLVSPSFSTGWDFPDDEARFAIICKVPFPPAVSKVMKRRLKHDPQYGAYLAMQDLCQGCWRIMRHGKDWGRVWIVDGMAGWFLHKNRNLAPLGFVERVVRLREVKKVGLIGAGRAGKQQGRG